MKSPTVRSHCSYALYKKIVFDEREFLEICEKHQVPDLLWLAEHRDVGVRIRDPMPAETKWLKLERGATVVIAVAARGVRFVYFAGAAGKSELVAVVVQFFPDSEKQSSFCGNRSGVPGRVRP